MNRIGLIVGGVLLALMLLPSSTLFVVDQRQVASSTRWVRSRKSSPNRA
jgi:hypothetical protein